MTRIKREVQRLQEWAASWQSVDALEEFSGVNKRTLYRFRKSGEASLSVLDKLSSARERSGDQDNGDKAA